MSINYLRCLEECAEVAERRRNNIGGLTEWEWKVKALTSEPTLKATLTDLAASVGKINTECGDSVRTIYAFLQMLKQFSKLLSAKGKEISDQSSAKAYLDALLTKAATATKMLGHKSILIEVETFTEIANTIDARITREVKEMEQSSEKLKDTIQQLEAEAKDRHQQEIQRVDAFLNSIGQGIDAAIKVGASLVTVVATGEAVAGELGLGTKVLNSVAKLPEPIIGNVAVNAVKFLFPDYVYPRKEEVTKCEKELLEKIEADKEDLFKLIEVHAYSRSLIVKCLMLVAAVDIFWKKSYQFLQQLPDPPTRESLQVSPDQLDKMLEKISEK